MVQQALQNVYDQLTEQGFDVVYLAIQGSTNYHLDVYSNEYQSDYDMKAFIMPTFEDLYYNRFISKTYEQPYGQVTIHDIRKLPELISKANPSYMEILFTPYYIGTPLMESIREKSHDVVEERKAMLVKSIFGMMLEKEKALCHPYEGLVDKLEMFGGYDPKQLHHAYRLYYMLDAIIHSTSFEDTIVLPEDIRERLIDIKVHGVGSKEEALRQMNEVMTLGSQLYHTVWQDKQPIWEIQGTHKEEVEALIFEAVKGQYEQCICQEIYER